MSEQVAVDVRTFSRLIADYFGRTSLPEKWTALFGESLSASISGRLADRTYWLDLYSRREEAAAVTDLGLASELRRVVRDLSSAAGESLAFFMIERSGFGYFVWLDADLSRVVSCIRLRDKRILDQG